MKNFNKIMDELDKTDGGELGSTTVREKFKTESINWVIELKTIGNLYGDKREYINAIRYDNYIEWIKLFFSISDDEISKEMTALK